ncbi:MAG: Ig-like domain-containing protein, partial [Gaiellaceae bacterium]
SDSADAGSGVASVSFQRSPAGAGSWTEIASDATSPYGAGWNTSAVADGSYELRVVTSDSAGNSHTSAPVSVTVDNTDPTGSLTRPGTNVFVKREVAVSSDSADPTSGVAWVAFEIAPSSYGPWQTAATVTSAPWSASVRFPKMAQGRYYVRAVTSDRAGNTFVSQTRRIGLDNTAPTSSIACNGKQGCRTVYFKSVYVAFSAYDRGSGVRAIRYTTNGKIPTASSSLYRRPLKLKKSMVVRWRVWDRAGNVSLTWSRAIKVSAPHRAH